MDLTLKNLPEVLSRRLRSEAASRSCSVEALILVTLQQTFGEPPAERRALLARIRRRLAALTLWLDEATLAFAKRHGRE
jgi:plasmid stability protein